MIDINEITEYFKNDKEKLMCLNHHKKNPYKDLMFLNILVFLSNKID